MSNKTRYEIALDDAANEEGFPNYESFESNQDYYTGDSTHTARHTARIHTRAAELHAMRLAEWIPKITIRTFTGGYVRKNKAYTIQELHDLYNNSTPTTDEQHN